MQSLRNREASLRALEVGLNERETALNRKEADVDVRLRETRSKEERVSRMLGSHAQREEELGAWETQLKRGEVALATARRQEAEGRAEWAAISAEKDQIERRLVTLKTEEASVNARVEHARE